MMSAIVHLELHTRDSAEASDFYARLFGWQATPITTRYGTYLALGLGGDIGGGIAECGAEPSLWLPYVEVDRVDAVTERARRLGASVLLEPREGPAGWRSVVSAPCAGEVALWQPKEWR
jgi:predicted enzyme related to lactoylglutathione lyase